MKKILMLDLDGTLLATTGSVLTPAFVNKIIALTNKGWMFSVNSARPYDSLKRFLAPLENRTLFICNDGAQITVSYTQKLLNLQGAHCARNGAGGLHQGFNGRYYGFGCAAGAKRAG